MADTKAATGLTVQQWGDDCFYEYVRENKFNKYQGTGEQNIVQVKDKLTNKVGKWDTYALMNRMTGAGRTGNQVLENYEEDLTSRSHRVAPDWIRNAFLVDKQEAQYSAIDLLEAGKSQLKTWIMENLRDNHISALGSINGTAYASASEANKDAWLVDNADRVLFGAATSNNSSNDHSASLANIDSTNDKLSAAALGIMKRMAKNGSPKIRPTRNNKDEEWYVVFAGTYTFRDLQNDSVIQQANREAWARGADNPLFTGGDLIYDGMIIREIPEIGVISGVGAGAINVGPVYLCGAQALGLCWAQRLKVIPGDRDWKFRNGFAAEECRVVEKLRFGTGNDDTDDPKDHGVVTGYFSAVAD